jgi:D-tyrosyl-tRNA(Tyr) deacylase
MRAVVQRVDHCVVCVGERETGKIERGLLVYLGVGQNDTEADAEQLSEKIAGLRIFPDSAYKLNLSVQDVGGRILVVSQFTLYGDARSGRRPSYSEAAGQEKALPLYESFIQSLEKLGITTARGEFAASMKVTYTNDGPITILLDSEKRF